MCRRERPWKRELARADRAFIRFPAEALGDDARAAFEAFREGLESGRDSRRRAGPRGLDVNGWVKKGILLGFRLGRIVAFPDAGPLTFLDKDTFPPRRLTLEDRYGWCPAAPRCGRAPTSAPGWWSCPRPTSTWAPTWARGA